MPVVAIDFGGTKIKLGVIDDGGEIILITQIKAVADKSITESLNNVTKHLHELLEQDGIDKKDLKGIGIAVPSIVDTERNIVLSRYVKYSDANEFDFNKWAKETWDLPVVLANDAKAALIGEWQYGAGKGYDNLAMITLGTGVGSAVLINRKLLNGTHFLAGNLMGHLSININGKPCNCGFFGCLETEASTWVLPSLIAEHADYKNSALSKIDKPEFIHLFEEADNGDQLASEILQHCLKAWGVCAVNIVHAYDPARIIISGGIMKRKEQILPYVQKMVDEYSWLPPGSTEIVAAEQVEYANLLGMEYLVNSATINP